MISFTKLSNTQRDKRRANMQNKPCDATEYKILFDVNLKRHKNNLSNIGSMCNIGDKMLKSIIRKQRIRLNI